MNAPRKGMLSQLTGLARKALGGSGSASGGPSSTPTDWRQIVRSAADALTGDGNSQQAAARPDQTTVRAGAVGAMSEADRSALARYDYLLKTADPGQIEQVHSEAFDRLTPQQRTQVEQRMRLELAEHEHPRSAAPADLARTAARTEASRPGFLPGLLQRAGGRVPGASAGRKLAIGGAAAGAGFAAGGLLASVAAGAVVSSVAAPLLAQAADLGVDFDALGSAIDLEGITGGFDGLASNAGDTVTGLGDQVGGIGSALGGFGLDDLLGR